MEYSFYTNVIEFAMSSGVLMKTSMQECTHAPFTMFPTPIPRRHYEELKCIQPYINKLMFLASRDCEFLLKSLKSVFEADEFSKNLFDIFEKAKLCNAKSKFDLGILRSDYLFDDNSDALNPKQIEINTIAPGFGGIGGSRLRDVHEKSLREAKRHKDISSLASNPSAEEIAKGLVKGWNAYGNSLASIVFLVIENEANVFDQRIIEYSINACDDNIPVRRKTFKEMIAGVRLADDGKLFIQDEEVAVVYYRTGYSPEDYISQKHWDTRLIIEKSKAIKCPSVALQLTGSKKFQEILARPGSIERFIEDKEAVAAIRKTFAGLYTLEMNPEGDRSVQMALACPENYVMKPQREGGGNNIYGKDIVPILHQIGNCEKRTAYILMDRIRPKSAKNYIASKYSVAEYDCVSELGVFGVILAENGKIMYNSAAGHILRTKAKDVNEGGIMAGAAVLDSPLLV